MSFTPKTRKTLRHFPRSEKFFHLGSFHKGQGELSRKERRPASNRDMVALLEHDTPDSKHVMISGILNQIFEVTHIAVLQNWRHRLRRLSVQQSAKLNILIRSSEQ